MHRCRWPFQEEAIGPHGGAVGAMAGGGGEDGRSPLVGDMHGGG
jgi:hypothetical protein